MRFATLNEISMRDLLAMAHGAIEDTITDMDFLETLAAHQCILVTPWVVRAKPEGGLERVTRLIYTIDGELDKARILLAVAREMRRARNTRGFGPRFSA